MIRAIAIASHMLPLPLETFAKPCRYQLVASPALSRGLLAGPGSSPIGANFRAARAGLLPHRHPGRSECGDPGPTRFQSSAAKSSACAGRKGEWDPGLRCASPGVTWEKTQHARIPGPNRPSNNAWGAHFSAPMGSSPGRRIAAGFSRQMEVFYNDSVVQRSPLGEEKSGSRHLMSTRCGSPAAVTGTR